MMGKATSRGFKGLYAIAVVIALFTGFGSMPLWGRYYIADIPGLKWSGDFFVNLQIHLFVGALLLCLAVYMLVYYLNVRSSGVRLTRSGRIRAVFLVLAILSGVAMAIRNLSGIQFAFEWQVSLVFLHMGVAVAFMVASIVCLIARCRWTLDSTSAD